MERGWSMQWRVCLVYAQSLNTGTWTPKLPIHIKTAAVNARHQLPIAPDFGRTAYSTQGFTLPAGKIGLNLGVNADAVTAYVAMSRFKTANDLIILQPFDLQTFQ